MVKEEMMVEHFLLKSCYLHLMTLATGDKETTVATRQLGVIISAFVFCWPAYLVLFIVNAVPGVFTLPRFVSQLDHESTDLCLALQKSFLEDRGWDYGWIKEEMQGKGCVRK